MENKTGILGNPLSSLKVLLVSLIIVGFVTGGNLWLHRGDAPLGEARYSGHGFSIDYSSMMQVQEMGLTGGVATESIGMIQGRMDGRSLEQFGVMWFKPDQLPSYYDSSPRDALKYVFDTIASSGTVITNIGEERSTTVNDHDVIYQNFDIEDEVTIPGVIGVWYCKESDMFMVLYLVHLPDLEQPDLHSPELVNMWLDYLDTVSCHASS